MEVPYSLLGKFFKLFAREKPNQPPTTMLREADLAALNALQQLDSIAEKLRQEKMLLQQETSQRETRRQALLKQYESTWKDLQALINKYPDRAWAKYCPFFIPAEVISPEELSVSFPAESFGDSKVPDLEDKVEEISRLFSQLRITARKKRKEMRQVKFNT